MIVGIGIDSVEIDRFSQWYTYSEKKLRRIFSQEEIDYCLAQKNKSAERFAIRFAAKEAFFKAFFTAYPQVYMPFVTMCRFVSIQKEGGRPVLFIDWKQLNIIDNSYACHISLTHTRTTAAAFVIIEKTT